MEPIRSTNDKICIVKKYRSSNQQRKRKLKSTEKESYPRAVAQKPARFEKRPREGLLLFAQLQENKNTARETARDAKLLERFLKTDEDRKIEHISFSAVELNKYIGQFIISVRTKDGTECEPPRIFAHLPACSR